MENDMRGKVEFDATTQTWYRYAMTDGVRYEIRGPKICDIALSHDFNTNDWFVMSQAEASIDIDRQCRIAQELQRYRDRFGPI